MSGTSISTSKGKRFEATAVNNGYNRKHSYDSLNRLSLYTELGGSVRPPIYIETKYDAHAPSASRLMTT